ncbi:MAG: TIGR03936 family radical SAM-associated protein [Clostridia bacterium]|nr:TIGR03936 family radical SAM-associated protein [Clostridia bacterium]
MKMIVVFEKAPRLRHIGHLDLMRAMQRALRRSGLPLRYSQGFNPHILLTFAAPLSVGMPGKREIMEVPLEGEVQVEEFMAKLSAALPPDLPLISARPVDDRHPAPMAQLAAAVYEAVLTNVPAGLDAAIGRFLAQTEINVMRKTKSGMKPSDIRPMIYDLRLTGDTLHMALALSEKATCKPDLLLQSLFDFAGLDRPPMLITRLQLLGEEDGVLKPLENL